MARFVACVLLLLAWAAASSAREFAPLPRGFEAPPASQPLPGLYAHAIARDSTDEALEQATLDCRARGGIEIIGDRGAIGVTEIWVYRTQSQIARYAEQGLVEINTTNCTATVTRRRSVARRLVTDGGFVRVRPPRDESPNQQWTVEAITNSAHGWPDPLNGGDVRSERCGERIQYQACVISRVQGVRAICKVDTASFDVFHYCVSISRGLSRGMALSRLSEFHDGGRSHSYEVDELDERTGLNPALFAMSNSWARGSRAEDVG